MAEKLEGRKTLFATSGGVLFASGLALVGTAIAAIIDAPPRRDLIVEWVVLGLAVGIIVIGSYVFVAAMSDRLWLPGMKRLRDAHAAAAADHAWARLVLTTALKRGSTLADPRTPVNGPESNQATEWYSAVLEFIRGMWGETEMTLIVGSSREIPMRSQTATEILLRLERFLAPIIHAAA